MKNLIMKLGKSISKFYWWLIGKFQTRYTIQVSYDSEWGNEDDVRYVHVRKIIKSNFKELKFRTDDKKDIHIKAMNGLRYKIEVE